MTETDLVRVFDGGFRVSGRVADDDGGIDFAGCGTGAADNLDRHLIVD